MLYIFMYIFSLRIYESYFIKKKIFFLDKHFYFIKIINPRTNMGDSNNFNHNAVNEVFMNRFNLPMQFINSDAITNT